MIIKTSRQLKDKVANIAAGDSKKAQMLIRKYMMERFLVRIANSEYKNNFILKGGMLVSAILGVEARATMDIDTTVRSLPLTKENATSVITEIMNIKLDDNLSFEIKNTEDIMEEHDYSGVRFTITVVLEKLKDTIKIDVSTGDIIVPEAIEFSYPSMFGDERIYIWSYNLETMFAEKLETIVARDTANTRMRDFYDIHTLWAEKSDDINVEILKSAIITVARKRNTLHLFDNSEEIIRNIRNSTYLRDNWNNYKKNNYYVDEIEWEDTVDTVNTILHDIVGSLQITV